HLRFTLVLLRYSVHLSLHSFPTRRSSDLKMLTMTNLSTECLIQLTKLGYDATPFNQILKQNAKREMRLRLGKVTEKLMDELERIDRKSGSAGMPRPNSYAVFCLKKKT